MKGRDLLFVVLAGLLIGAVITAVEVPGYHPYIPQPLAVSLTNTTVIRVDMDHADWTKGIWSDWDPLYAYFFDFWIIVEPC